MPAPAPKAAAPKPKAMPDVAAARKVTGQFQTAPAPIERKETKEKPAAPIGRTEAAKPAFNAEDVLAELFEKMQDIYTEKMTKEGIANFLLDLALKYVKSDAGTFYTSSLSEESLEFTAVRGPAAKELLKSGIKVPVGQGIVGFCAQEGVSLAVSDVQKDARFSAAISEKIGYACRTMICSPLYKDGRLWGAIQLINRVGASSYQPQEVDVLNYIAHEGATLLTHVEE
ncbi:MAG: GAF domain-containing protein [Deltaproteobacteria bacterium]|nr:GAF domain-containing protein [Deltaproteobacteria bacterium]